MKASKWSAVNHSGFMKYISNWKDFFLNLNSFRQKIRNLNDFYFAIDEKLLEHK